MKRKVYQSAEDEYIEMEVLARYRYLGETDEFYFINGKIYDCVGYDEDLDMLILVDETEEDYMYKKDNFELVEDFRK